MRFAFRELPAAGGGVLTPRPVVDIALEGLDAAPVGCLLDTGALRTRMSAELAPLAGIELPGALTEHFFIGGLKTAGALARVHLTVNDGADEFEMLLPAVERAMSSPGTRRSGSATHGPTHSGWPGSRASCITSS